LIRRILIALFILLETTQISFGQVDTSTIAILPCYQVDLEIFSNCNSAELTNQDLQTIDTLLKEFVVQYNVEQTRQFNLFTPEAKAKHVLLLLDLKKLRRQYVGTINPAGEKVVWLNCFCNSLGKNWRKEIIKSSGERMCNFKISINLTNKKHFDFRLLPLKGSI